ncbi:MAG: Brp/Blh family beta-carotene 15,15'-dioxygenase [Halobacteriales archaeon]
MDHSTMSADRATDPGADSDRVGATLSRTVLWPSWLVVFALAAFFSLGGSLSAPLRYFPLLASVVLVGLPHGAVDHLAIPRTRDEAPTAGWFARIGLLYAVLGGAYAVLWFLAPVASAVGFILLTWVHWGQGDLWPLLAVAGVDHLGSRLQRALTAAVRGGLPMLVPLLSFPNRYRAVVEGIVARFGLSAAPLDPVFRPETRLALLAGFALLSVVTLAVGALRADDRSGWAVDAGETALLWWFFWVVPPVFAIGAYFTVWHSLRHVARLVAVDPGGREALARDRPLAALSRFARDAAPLTALSLVGLAGLYLAVPNPPTDVPGVVALYLVFIAVLTLPHVVVVAVMDREQAVWTPGGRSPD